MKKILVHLVRNYLNKKKVTYRAQPTGGKMYSFDDLIERAVQKHTVVSATDLKAGAMVLDEVCMEVIAEGNNYSTNLYYTSTSVRGEFESKTARFNRDTHTLCLNLHPTAKFRKMMDMLSVEIVHIPEDVPTIEEVIDTLTETVNSIISVNNMVIIRGINIKIDGTDPAVGLYLINSAGVETKIFVAKNNPSELDAIIPALPAGEYTLKVVTQYKNGRSGKDVLTGIFSMPLTIS